MELRREALKTVRDLAGQPVPVRTDVTLDQCYRLAEQLAIGARIVAP